MLLLALFVLWQNLSYPLGNLAEPGAGFVPLFLGLALAAVSMVIIFGGGSSRSLKVIGWAEAPRVVLILAAFAGAAFALERVGYRLTIFGLLVFLIGVVERRPVIPTATAAIGFSALTYFVFVHLLEVQLPRGPWGL